ncbi:MAG: hypothetical protein SNG38_00770 [Rikenellaceae bacterium]
MKFLFNKYTFSVYLILLIAAMVYSPGDTGIHNPIGYGELGDYVMHFLVYTPWMFFGCYIYGSKFQHRSWFLIGTTFVIALELLQALIPYREFNILDMIVGEVGLGCSYFAILQLTKKENDDYANRP